MDGDGQHDASDIAKLTAPVRDGELDLVLGSRFLEAGGYRFGMARSAGRDLFGAIARRFGLELSDPTTGYQAMNAKVLALYSGDFFPADYPDVDVLLVAHRHGIRIGERSVAMAPGRAPIDDPRRHQAPVLCVQDAALHLVHRHPTSEPTPVNSHVRDPDPRTPRCREVLDSGRVGGWVRDRLDFLWLR